MAKVAAEVEKEDTKFKPGNQIWKQRRFPGRPLKISTPDEFWDEASKYFQWAEDNPLKEEKVFCFQGEIVRTSIDKLRAMTIQGLCLHMGISDETLTNYEKKTDYIGIIGHVRKCIYEQKFSGAAADLLNPTIIIRELGLIDKTEDVGSKPTPIEITIPVADASKKD